MFDIENAENIEKFNAITGMKHRSAPYDLNNPEDLKQAFLLTVAACMDYRRYWRQLSTIEEEFDESLECYDTATWLNMSLSPEKTDELAVESFCSLRETTGLFQRLMERADRNCIVILKDILSASGDTQKTVWGKAYDIPAGELDSRIEELFEALEEAEMHYTIDKNQDEFIALMNETWG